MPDKLELGERLKRFRLGRNLTLKEVELKAKVSATHISEIERGMTSPTVGALTKIARALGTEPSYFLQSDESPMVSVVRRDERRVLQDSAWGARLNRLCTGVRGSEMSFLEIELDRGLSETVEPISHQGEEFMYILKGVVEVHIGGDRHLLKEGDSLHYRLNDPHTIRNIGDGTAKLMWATMPPFCL
jgi:transcriptional regulator with XRE-family HTH domain